MVVVTQVPATAKPGDAYTDPVAVVGKVTQVALANNTPLVPGFFSTPALSITSSGTGSTAVSVETQITKGYVAVAIPTNAALPQNVPNLVQNNFTGPLVSDGFYILPGDHIDILVQSTQRHLGDALHLPGPHRAPRRQLGQHQDRLRLTCSSSRCPAPRRRCSPALVIGDGHEFVVKYVLRPESEWGKLSATGYTPNYEIAGAVDVPSVKQTIVTPSTLDSLFGG